MKKKLTETLNFLMAHLHVVTAVDEHKEENNNNSSSAIVTTIHTHIIHAQTHTHKNDNNREKKKK